MSKIEVKTASPYETSGFYRTGRRRSVLAGQSMLSDQFFDLVG